MFNGNACVGKESPTCSQGYTVDVARGDCIDKTERVCQKGEVARMASASLSRANALYISSVPWRRILVQSSSQRILPALVLDDQGNPIYRGPSPRAGPEPGNGPTQPNAIVPDPGVGCIGKVSDNLHTSHYPKTIRNKLHQVVEMPAGKRRTGMMEDRYQISVVDEQDLMVSDQNQTSMVDDLIVVGIDPYQTYRLTKADETIEEVISTLVERMVLITGVVVV